MESAWLGLGLAGLACVPYMLRRVREKFFYEDPALRQVVMSLLRSTLGGAERENEILSLLEQMGSESRNKEVLFDGDVFGVMAQMMRDQSSIVAGRNEIVVKMALILRSVLKHDKKTIPVKRAQILREGFLEELITFVERKIEKEKDARVLLEAQLERTKIELPKEQNEEKTVLFDADGDQIPDMEGGDEELPPSAEKLAAEKLEKEMREKELKLLEELRMREVAIVELLQLIGSLTVFDRYLRSFIEEIPEGSEGPSHLCKSLLKNGPFWAWARDRLGRFEDIQSSTIDPCSKALLAILAHMSEIPEGAKLIPSFLKENVGCVAEALWSNDNNVRKNAVIILSAVALHNPQDMMNMIGGSDASRLVMVVRKILEVNAAVEHTNMKEGAAKLMFVIVETVINDKKMKSEELVVLRDRLSLSLAEARTLLVVLLSLVANKRLLVRNFAIKFQDLLIREKNPLFAGRREAFVELSKQASILAERANNEKNQKLEQYSKMMQLQQLQQLQQMQGMGGMGGLPQLGQAPPRGQSAPRGKGVEAVPLD